MLTTRNILKKLTGSSARTRSLLRLLLLLCAVLVLFSVRAAGSGDLPPVPVPHLDPEAEHLGIDVSEFQGDIDWDKVKTDGVEFVMIRAGCRGYETGIIYEDTKAHRNLAGANAAGIPAGVYFYTMAVNEAEVLEEADFVLRILRDHVISLPVVIDVELPSEPGRTDGLLPEERTDLVLAFCGRIREAGYEPMLYSNARRFDRLLQPERLQDIPIWFAAYAAQLDTPYDCAMWQYSDAGTVKGIAGPVDLDLIFAGKMPEV